MTIKVAAGAVAEEIAPKRMATCKGCSSIKYKLIVTKRHGKRAAISEI